MSTQFYDPATWTPQPELDRALSDKGISGGDAEAVKAFAEFLHQAGPTFKVKDGKRVTGTAEQERWRRQALRDPQWREFIGLPPLPVGQPAVSALVRDLHGRILLGRKCHRPGNFLSGRWHLPGGKALPGETDEQALRRELAEETGIVTLEIGELLGEIEQDQFLVRWYAASATGSVTAGSDLTDAGFYDLAEVASLVDLDVVALWPPSIQRAVLNGETP